MYHPWRELRRLSDWSLTIAALPPGHRGCTHWGDRAITLRPGMTQAERRCVLAHELTHVERGVFLRGWRDQEEHRVRVSAARRLIGIEELEQVLRWSRDWREVADELWVTVDTLRVRVAHLSASEATALARAVDQVTIGE